MRDLVDRTTLHSILLAAVVFCTAGWTDGLARSGKVSSPQATGGMPGVTNLATDDLGGTPADVQSLSSDSNRSVRVAPAQASQSEARRAVENGEVRPFGWLLKRLKKAVPGDVVKVRLKRHLQDTWTYEVTVLNASGRYVQVSLDAATGAVIKTTFR
jgi:hypothetical protein